MSNVQTPISPPIFPYVIGTSTGGFIGKPILEGFDKKWRILRKGNDLILTSLGGTVMILR